MLSESVRQLLTAAVDGELTHSQRRRLDQILQESPEAREFLSGLQQDQSLLRQLSPKPLPSQFAHSLMRSIQNLERKPQPVQASFSFYLSPTTWIPIATAACVLIAVGMGSFLYFATSRDHQFLANSVDRPSPPNSPEVELPQPGLVQANDVPGLELIPPPRGLNDQIVQQYEPLRIEQLPHPREQESKALFAPSSPPLIPRVVETPRLPIIFSIREFDQASTREKLNRELQGNEAMRFEFFCKDPLRSFQTIRTQFGSGARFLVEETVADRIKKKQPTQFALFTDSTTSDTVLRLVDALASADKKSDLPSDRAVVAVFQTSDQAELGQFLGVPTSQVFKYKSQTMLRPFHESTPEQLASKLAQRNQGAPGETSRHDVDRQVLVVGYPSGRSVPGPSTLVKSFLDQRREPPAKTFPALIILRSKAN